MNRIILGVIATLIVSLSSCTKINMNKYKIGDEIAKTTKVKDFSLGGCKGLLIIQENDGKIIGLAYTRQGIDYNWIEAVSDAYRLNTKEILTTFNSGGFVPCYTKTKGKYKYTVVANRTNGLSGFQIRLNSVKVDKSDF